LPLITILSFFVTYAFKQGAAFVVVVFCVVVKSDCVRIMRSERSYFGVQIK
jgi:hypothetical protein